MSYNNGKFGYNRRAGSLPAAGGADITITAGVNNRIDFDEGGLGEVNCTLVAATYTRADLAAQITTRLNVFAALNTYLCTYDSGTAKFTIARDTGADSISFLWQTGSFSGTCVGPDIGFPTTADSTGATTYTGAAVP